MKKLVQENDYSDILEKKFKIIKKNRSFIDDSYDTKIMNLVSKMNSINDSLLGFEQYGYKNIEKNNQNKTKQNKKRKKTQKRTINRQIKNECLDKIANKKNKQKGQIKTSKPKKQSKNVKTLKSTKK